MIHRLVAAGAIRFHIHEAGEGPTIALLAGFPQCSYAWRRLMPLLAKRFRVIAIDLPGQGDSDKPFDGYDTLTAAARINTLMTVLGEDRYIYVGHDIGAWVGFPFGHKYSEHVRGMVLLDANIPGVTLCPTIELGQDNWRNWHFLFNPIPDLPEALLQGRERILIEWFFRRKTANYVSTFSKEDIDEYERVYAMPGGMRGMLGYYRAVISDIEQNKLLMEKLLEIPVLALGGDAGSSPDLFDRVKPLGKDVRGGLIKDSGHYVAEEQPETLARELIQFADTLPV